MLAEGMTASISFIVDESSTAISLGSGDVPVLGTPKVVALLEQASVAAIAGSLDPGTTTVGTHVALDHVAPSPVGSTVLATATVTSVAGRKLSFRIELVQADEIVASGTHTRAVVARSSFLRK